MNLKEFFSAYGATYKNYNLCNLKWGKDPKYTVGNALHVKVMIQVTRWALHTCNPFSPVEKDRGQIKYVVLILDIYYSYHNM